MSARVRQYPESPGKKFELNENRPDKVLANSQAFNFAASIGSLAQEIGTFSKVKIDKDLDVYLDLKIQAEAAQKKVVESIPSMKQKGEERSDFSLTNTEGSKRRFEDPNSKMNHL